MTLTRSFYLAPQVPDEHKPLTPLLQRPGSTIPDRPRRPAREPVALQGARSCLFCQDGHSRMETPYNPLICWNYRDTNHLRPTRPSSCRNRSDSTSSPRLAFSDTVSTIQVFMGSLYFVYAGLHNKDKLNHLLHTLASRTLVLSVGYRANLAPKFYGTTPSRLQHFCFYQPDRISGRLIPHRKKAG